MFYEPEIFPEAVINEKPKVFTEEFLSSVIKKTILSGDIPADHKLYFVAATDETGVKAIIGVTQDLFGGNLKINFIAEHEWDGDNKAGAKVIWSHK